jgi:hypothetical protein
MGRGACGSRKSMCAGTASSWASVTFQVGRRTRSPRRKPSGFSEGPRPPEGSVVSCACSSVNSSRAWKRVASSVCYRRESAAVLSSGFEQPNPIRIQLLFEDVIIRCIILWNREVKLCVVCQKTPMGSRSLDDHTWGIKSGGCCRFRISLSRAVPCRFMPWMELMNSVSRRLVSLHLLRWFRTFMNGPAPHAEQNRGSSIACMGRRWVGVDKVY